MSIVPRPPLPPISSAPIRILDVCCGEGGVSAGLHAAFPNASITGVDNNPHPLKRYPPSFNRILGDALVYLASPEARAAQYDFIWASFPCQSFTPLRALNPQIHYPDLIEEGRALIAQLNPPLSYILENVPQATFAFTMRADVTLCGLPFGLRTYRHRIFESPLPLVAPPHQKHVAKVRARSASRTNNGMTAKEEFEAGLIFATVAGNVGAFCGPEAMGIDWMSGKGLSQSIPPAYAHYLAQFIPVASDSNHDPLPSEIAYA